MTLAVVTLIYVCHSIDRSVMSILVEPVKAEFALTDGEMGILTGLAYGIFYSLAAVPIGYLLDRYNRRNVLATLVSLWSGFTLVCGLAHSYWQLLIARIFVGAAEAGGAPASLSIISDVFPEQKRSTAISIFWLSTAIGTAISFGLGGYVASHYGWRATFMLAGIPGFVLVVVLLVFVREPRRGALDQAQSGDKEETPELGTVLRFIVTNKPVAFTLLAMALKSMVLSGAVVWAAAYLIRVQGLPIAQVGIVVGISIALFGGIGSLLGGVAGDWAYKRGGRRAQPLVAVLTSVLTAGVLLIFALSGQVIVALVSFALFEVASRMHTAPSYAFLISNSPARTRGVIISTLQIMTNLFGYGLGPYFVGVISDGVGGSESLRYGLASLSVIALLSALAFYWSTRPLTGEQVN